MDTKPKKLNPGLAIAAGILLLGGACVLTSCGGGSSGASQTPPAATAVDVALMRQDADTFVKGEHSNSEKAHTAVAQYTDAVVAGIADANNREQSLEHGNEVNNAFQCLEYTLGSADAAYAETTAFEDAVIRGHDDRMTAYLHFMGNNAAVSAAFADAPGGLASTCKVNPDTLPN